MKDQGTIFVFPPHRLDPLERRLSRDGELVSLTPKEFDTLLVLIEAGGRVVGKEELIGRVWPDSYVGDGSLARNISVLRKALGEEVIETLPKRGYRIDVPVRRIEGTRERPFVEAIPELAARAMGTTPAAPALPRRRWWWQRAWLLAAAACAVMAGLAFRVAGTNSAKTRSGHDARCHKFDSDSEGWWT